MVREMVRETVREMVREMVRVKVREIIRDTCRTFTLTQIKLKHHEFLQVKSLSSQELSHLWKQTSPVTCI